MFDRPFFIIQIIRNLWIVHSRTLTEQILSDDTLWCFERIGFSNGVDSFHTEEILLAMRQSRYFVAQYRAHASIGPSASRQIHFFDNIVQYGAATIVQWMAPSQVTTFLGDFADLERFLWWWWPIEDGDSGAWTETFYFSLSNYTKLNRSSL